MTQIVLTSASVSPWVVPGDWNNTNTIEAIGAGGNGWGPGSGFFAGGGGAYAKISNLTLTPGANITFQIGLPQAVGVAAGAGTTPPMNTWFRDGATLVAAGAATKVSGAAGTAANSVGTVKNSGGAGSNSGGGAGGPTGAGLAGVGGGAPNVGGAGDAGSATGGVGGVGSAPAGNGGDGTLWTPNGGSGGGGGCDHVGGAGNGGRWGGGGATTNWGGTGLGGNGVIVITYTPIPPPPLSQALWDRLPVAAFVPLLLRQAFAEWPFIATIALTPAIQFSAREDALPSRAITASQLLARMAAQESRVAWGMLPPPAPAGTPAYQFSARDDTLPGRFVQVSALLTRMSAVESQSVLGLWTPPPPPIVTFGRITISPYMFVPLDELVFHANDFINRVNANLNAWGIDPHNFIPGFQQLSPNELTEGLNLIVEQLNNQFDLMGLPQSQNIQYFVGVGPDEATMAFAALIDDTNTVLLNLFGA
ncbi:MAG: hypothetical protein C5B60_01540 [Chloroflexi bacterium]|nr:MAG: hypothetical protein C5B60_01540 [Chloroflexota bacterium]